MQDIDFDEIDRAVNSVTSGDVQTTVSAHTAPDLSNEPAASVPNPVAIETPTIPEAEAPAIATPASRRSSGRFMDVVHPSSDMRPSASTSSRSAPSAPSFYRKEVAERPEIITARPEPATTQSGAFHWPDPIDVSATAPVVVPSVDTPAFVVEMPAVTPETKDNLEDEMSASLESPFLMGAKIEKRPLGAFSGADADLPLLEDPMPFSTNVATEPEIDPEVQELFHEEHEEVPHELHDQLLALDGHGQDYHEDELLLEAVNPPDPISEAVEVPEVFSGPTSITQQYKEQPSSVVESSGSIFDTEAYHKALTHPPKKRSGAMIVVWIIALILVGGGIGAAVYFVVLPMLG
ncbi:hypothetical protein H7100_02085 [Candidatus Saccharibacteria bacterium]|nr:hypothetical protein [Candidatus Saccharibacteria bacterium]